MCDRTAVAVMVKYPRAGCVKTRLGRRIGMEKAAALYRRFVQKTLETCRTSGLETVISCHPGHSLKDFMAWLGSDYTFIAQNGPDIGFKMRDCFERVFSLGFSEAILIGSDLPHLPVSFIETAAREVKEADLVLGPAMDGGYYLVAMKKDGFFPRLFDGIPWSTPDVLAKTLEKIDASRKNVFLLPVLRDIDTLEDLTAVSRETGLFSNSDRGIESGKRPVP